MDLVRRKVASFLIEEARKGIKNLDPGSACAKALKKMDVEKALNEDIERVCKSASISELTKVFSLATKLKLLSQEEKARVKGELKDTAGSIVRRVEKESGKLKTPKPCRHLLLKM